MSDDSDDLPGLRLALWIMAAAAVLGLASALLLLAKWPAVGMMR